MFARPPSKTASRPGAILAMVLVSLLVASMLGLALVKTILMHHRQMQVISRQQQCFWLAEAGVQRAVQKLSDSPDYRGEKWAIPAEALPHARPALVTIEIGQPSGAADTRELRVEARFSGEPPWPNAFRRETLVSMPTKTPDAAGNSGNSKNQPKNADSATNVPNDNQ